jgi:cytoskeletal protein CcmA (bactofilin family)
MWNRRKEEEPAPKPTSVPPIVSQPVKEGIPMSTQPARPLETRPEPARGGVAILGKSVILKGQIYGREDVTIDGEVEGTVELQEHRLTVGPTGKVVATIKAREIVVLGTVQGNIETREKIEIRKEAKVIGDIRTARIVIEDGAYFKGSIDIVRAEAPKPAAVPAAAPKPQPVASAGTPSPAAAASAGDIKR